MSKFDKIFEARDQVDEINLSKPATKKSEKAGSPTVKKSQSKFADIKETAPRGRPKAKRSDPDFLGFTTYIRRNTHTKVKIALLQEGKGRELSELVEELLGKWAENLKI